MKMVDNIYITEVATIRDGGTMYAKDRAGKGYFIPKNSKIIQTGNYNNREEITDMEIIDQIYVGIERFIKHREVDVKEGKSFLQCIRGVVENKGNEHIGE